MKDKNEIEEAQTPESKEIVHEPEKKEIVPENPEKGTGEEPKISFLLKLTFFCLGVSTLIAWNSVLSNMNYFQVHQTDGWKKPSLQFGWIFNILSFIFQFILIFTDLNISLKVLFITCQVLTAVLLMLLPITVSGFEDKSTTGFLLTCADLFIQGLVNGIRVFTCFSITGHFPKSCLVGMSVGEAISGILISIIGYICILTIYERDDISCWVYFSIASALLIFGLIVVIFAYRDDYFVKTVNTGKAVSDKKEPTTSTEVSKPTDEEEELPKHKKFCQLLSQTWVVDLMILLSYIGTFTIYPNVIFKIVFFTKSNEAWNKVSFTTAALIYNLGNTLGRKIVNLLPYSIKFLVIITLGRFILFVLLPLNVLVSSKGYNLGSGFFLIINLLILSVTNGICNSLCYALVPTTVKKAKDKGKGASTVGFFAVLGIECGNLLSFAMDALVNVIEPD